VSLKTLLLSSRTPSSNTLSAAGITVLVINGRGFDTARCRRNWVWLGGVQCAVLSCNTRQLTVWFPGENIADKSWHAHACLIVPDDTSGRDSIGKIRMHLYMHAVPLCTAAAEPC
jgi:hypothetical protein